LVTFEVKGGLDQAENSWMPLMLSLTANPGDTRSIATHPASTTHAKLTQQERTDAGISDGLIRISAGLEHIDDIIDDIHQALVASAS
jgi:O-succinylhomoserine sulfhydrylase